MNLHRVFLLLSSFWHCLIVGNDVVQQCMKTFCAPSSASARHLISDSTGPCFLFASQKPTPLLFNTCEDALLKGASFGCSQGCGRAGSAGICYGLTQSPGYAASQDLTCGPLSRVAPRPSLGDACRAGFTEAEIAALPT